MKKVNLEKRFAEGRKLERVGVGVLPSRLGSTGDGEFSLIELLRGTWTSQAQGWNLIALPFKDPSAKFNYRILMNQYGEKLSFNMPDKGVPNRGITPDSGETRQLIDAIAYEQIVIQKEVDDFPASGLRGKNEEGIHHEPGFFLQFLNHISVGHTEEDGEKNGPDVDLKIARLATIPHGNSVLAMGTVQHNIRGAPKIPKEDARPERINNNVKKNPYLAPYKHFEDNPFFGKVPGSVTGFPGLFATDANAILKFALANEKVKKHTILNFDTKFRNKQLTGIPISNIPFVAREADTTEMHATFWIMELDNPDESAPTEFIMQYSQTVYLEFFDSEEKDSKGKFKRIRWPHVSINTLKKSNS